MYGSRLEFGPVVKVTPRFPGCFFKTAFGMEKKNFFTKLYIAEQLDDTIYDNTRQWTLK